jgi:hypothetical protein
VELEQDFEEGNGMKKVKIVSLLTLLLLLGTLVLTFYITWSKAPASTSGNTSAETAPGGLADTTPIMVTTQLPLVLTPRTAFIDQSVTATPDVTVISQQVGAAPTRSPVIPTPSNNIADRYFTAAMSVAAMQSASQNISKQQVKILIEGQVDENWSVLQNKLGFTTKQKAYAFFLGFATRESTLQVNLETGSGPSHSYGPLQAAEPAYINSKNYAPEDDVPEMVQYDLTPQNFYDPGISIHSGMRHFLHFATQAQVAGYSGTELLRHALIGYNTGAIDGASATWMTQYSDEIGALAGWYLTNNHLTDTAFIWTNSPDVDRSNPWGWY